MARHARRRWSWSAGVTVAVALTAASCSSSDDTAVGTTASGAATSSTTGATAPADTMAPATTAAPETTPPTTVAVALPDGYAGHHSDMYGSDANWLCKPGIADDVCSRDLDATAIAADGSTRPVAHQTAADPPIDCFYVYSTQSSDPTPNSDLVVSEAEEVTAAYIQAARLNSSCRVFAPVYRPATLSTIGGGADTPAGADPWAVAYADVLDAFKEYVANSSDGRGFVLIGHSQGAAMLSQLLAEEIDDEPLLRDRLVSAYLLGWTVQVPVGGVVGGDFANVALCQAADQTGCIVTYASFLSTDPPASDAFFGRAGDGTRAACVNPAALTGGSATLHPYFLTSQPDTMLGGMGSPKPFTDPATAPAITTPWLTYPDFIAAECISAGDHDYLSITVNADPADPRTDDIGGNLGGGWGLHVLDVSLAMGDIEELVRSQAAAYAG